MTLTATLLWLCSAYALSADETVELGRHDLPCTDDPHCINRLHPAIPMIADAKPGQRIVMHARNAGDFSLAPDAPPDPRFGDREFGTVHPIIGPVRIVGAKAGDVIGVHIHEIVPGPYAWTMITPSGLVSDVIQSDIRVNWRLNQDYAVSDELPGIRIPNRSFPGIVTTLPGHTEHAAMLARERALAEAGGSVARPYPTHASPAPVCGPDGSHADECLRTIPPREHGGNLDIRYLRPGVTVYLPCQIDGCGLAVGDFHFAQGDGEVSGAALEMDATIAMSVDIIDDPPALDRGPHFAGDSTLLDIPSRKFHATTGFPLKSNGDVPSRLAYLGSEKHANLDNLSGDLTVAARNALLAMIDYIVESRGYTPEQAYIISSVAVDLRFGQVVDLPNVGVTAVLPLDIFVEHTATQRQSGD